jgi:glycosyltransferase involved in cell wall biosynthesis
LVDELGGADSGHRLVALFDGPADIRVDGTLGLPGGSHVSQGVHPRAAARLGRALRHIRPGIVVAHGGDAFKYLALATRVPIAYCVIGTWPASARKGPQHLLWKVLMRRAWVAAAVSDDVAADCREVLAVPDDRLVVIPNGRDADRFHPATEHPSGPGRAREVTLLFAGHLNEGKRPDQFVELVRALRAEGLPVTGKLVGDGPLRSDLKAQAAAAGVELVGWCADVVPLLQQADVFVFTSTPDGEGMPGVLIEAGLCGLPAVATRVAGTSTVIEDGRTGMIVPVADFTALVRATAELVRQPDRRTQMGAAARARCEAKFALPVVAHTWDTLLQGGLTLSRRDPRRMRAAALEPFRTSESL